MQTTNQKIEDILKRVDISNQSIAWWENKVISLMDQLDSLGENPKGEDLKKKKKLVEELTALIPRGRMEVNNIDKLEEEIKTLISNEKEKKKKGGDKNKI